MTPKPNKFIGWDTQPWQAAQLFLHSSLLYNLPALSPSHLPNIPILDLCLSTLKMLVCLFVCLFV